MRKHLPLSALANSYITSGEYYRPLPIRTLQWYGETPSLPTSSGVGCITSAVRLCDQEFSGAGFRACVYGTLVASNLLPTGAHSGLRSLQIEPLGAFTTGLSYSCQLNDPDNW